MARDRVCVGCARSKLKMKTHGIQVSQEVCASCGRRDYTVAVEDLPEGLRFKAPPPPPPPARSQVACAAWLKANPARLGFVDEPFSVADLPSAIERLVSTAFRAGYEKGYEAGHDNAHDEATDGTKGPKP